MAAVKVTLPGGYGPTLTVFARTEPAKLPVSSPAPVSLDFGFSYAALPENRVPGLRRMSFAFAHGVVFDAAGIRGGSRVGGGTVTSEIRLAGEAPVTVTGRIRAVFSKHEGQSAILAKVSTGEPLPVTYTIPFQIKAAKRPLGTRLVVTRMRDIQGICAVQRPNCFNGPYTLSGIYTHISALSLSLHRVVGARGSPHSFVSATCPPALDISPFPMMGATFDYEEGASQRALAPWRCRPST